MHKPEDCIMRRRAIQDTIEVLNGKWKFPIILTLMYKSYRFKELAREVGITPRMLSKELKELEMNKLVTRTVYDTKPVTVEYAITPYASSLADVMQSMSDWGKNHREVIAGEGKKKRAVA